MFFQKSLKFSFSTVCTSSSGDSGSSSGSGDSGSPSGDNQNSNDGGSDSGNQVCTPTTSYLDVSSMSGDELIVALQDVDNSNCFDGVHTDYQFCKTSGVDSDL